ncbi:probable E3 ubiquitin-protein ligase ATL44 [Triticum aestivum]|uniref:probable E3 ubiquitin-protein ligase ATL44 n=1 Tax=Triticum aestivum TaxID=4565 RepID=UPI001D035BFE|nr:probable E3 ubiquitin-protein ligase ATL44 [Triticum aestivum]
MASLMPSLAMDLPQEEGGHEDSAFLGVVGDPDDSELAALVAGALKTVDAPSDDDDELSCPICLEEDDAAAWKETPCGHRFHGWCVERWLQEKESCPMCRREVVTAPAATADCTAAHLHFLCVKQAALGLHVFGDVPVDDMETDDDDDA